MSDDSKTEKTLNSKLSAKPSPETAQDIQHSRKAFSRITTDLKSAIDQWETLSAQAPAISAEEQRFKDMQKLLKELHEKMKELNFI